MCSLTVHRTSCSNHDAIQVNFLSSFIPKKQFRFRFENTWLKDDSFHEEVSEFWAKIPTMHLLPKLLNVTAFMEKWGKKFFNKFREKVKAQKEVVAGLADRTDEQSVALYLKEKEKLNDILLHEEVYWKQRAKLMWLEEGDSNTKFFHASATARRKTNHVDRLQTDAGVLVDDYQGMCRVVKDYYTSIFSESLEVETSQLPSANTVSTEQNRSLVEGVTFDEFSYAIKQMHQDKAAGPDGLNPAFFQHFWGKMGKEVFECCKTWLDECSFPADLNNTNLVLIPKKTDAQCMKDFRPITLCNVLYKILAKVLANRFKDILPGLISENQSAFVAGRNITDNVLIAFEVIHHMKKKTGGNDEEVALKLDISKAYDRVDWNFLKHRMLNMGFCSKWIKWVMMCVTTVTYEVCSNGSLVGPIIPKRRL